MPQQRGSPSTKEPPLPPGYTELVYDQAQVKKAADESYTFPSASSLPQNVGIGIAKGLGQTIQGGGQMIRKYVPALDKLPSLELPINVKPTNWQQGLGSGMEHVAEYMYGGASVPFRAIPQGLMAAGLAGAHTGGDPEAMLGTGIIGAITPGVTGMVSRAASRVGSAISNSMPVQALQAYLRGHGVPTPPPAAGAPPLGGAATQGTRMLRGLPAGSSETIATTPKYEWSPGEASYSWQQPEAPTPPLLPKQLGSGTIPGQKMLNASPIVRPDGVIDTTGYGEAFGQEGGLSPQKNVDITGVKPKPVRTPEGPMRKGTADDLLKTGGVGRGITKENTGSAEPLKLPKGEPKLGKPAAESAGKATKEPPKKPSPPKKTTKEK